MVQTPTTVVLVPAYQPQATLGETTSELVAAGYSVVVVNDGSEATYDPVFASLDQRVQVLRHEQNRGKGAALKTGFAYIASTFSNYVIITADADGQHSVADIKKLADAYSEYDGALLLGARAFAARHVPLRSKFGNVLTRNVFWLITGRRLDDTQTGLRAFDQQLVDTMLAIPGERFEYEMNVLLACSRNGVQLVEIPIETIYQEKNYTSHFNSITDSLAIYLQIIKFASSSLLAFALDYTLFLLLVSVLSPLGVATSVVLANIGARLVSAGCNFLVNRRLVFRHGGNAMVGLAAYAALAGTLLLGNTLVITLLTTTVGLAPALAKILTECAFFFVSYAVQKKIIFR